MCYTILFNIGVMIIRIVQIYRTERSFFSHLSFCLEENYPPYCSIYHNTERFRERDVCERERGKEKENVCV